MNDCACNYCCPAKYEGQKERLIKAAQLGSLPPFLVSAFGGGDFANFLIAAFNGSSESTVSISRASSRNFSICAVFGFWPVRAFFPVKTDSLYRC